MGLLKKREELRINRDFQKQLGSGSKGVSGQASHGYSSTVIAGNARLTRGVKAVGVDDQKKIDLSKKMLVFHAISNYTECMKKSTKIVQNPIESVESSLQDINQRHRELLAELGDIGLVLRGSIGLYLSRCGNPTCRCKATPPILHGPYYKWTRKVAGKTVSASLSPEQAARLEEWSKNMHNLDRIVGELQDLGLRAATLLLQS